MSFTNEETKDVIKFLSYTGCGGDILNVWLAQGRNVKIFGKDDKFTPDCGWDKGNASGCNSVGNAYTLCKLYREIGKEAYVFMDLNDVNDDCWVWYN